MTAAQVVHRAQQYVVTATPPDQPAFTVIVRALSPDVACALVRKSLGKLRGARTTLTAVRFCTHETRHAIEMRRDPNRRLCVRRYECDNPECHEVIELIPV